MICYQQTEQEHSQKQSTLVNKAYRTLQEPLDRGLYLLELHGETIEEDDKHIDNEFLLEVMERNEDVADIDSVDKYYAVLKDNKRTLDGLYEQLSKAFQQDKIQTAKSILIRLKYYHNLQVKLKEQSHLYEHQ